VSALHCLANVRVVLVNTSHPGNIGAAARAMKNMGLRHLVLVDPKEFPSDVARWRAVSASDVVDSARVASNLSEAVADCSLVIAASARSRSMPWPMLDPRECGDRAVLEAPVNRVALVFGREAKGLHNDELRQCHYHVQIPADPEYASLNLASAVAILVYELRMAALARECVESGRGPAAREDMPWDIPRADVQQMERFYRHLEKVLVDIDFHDPQNPRQLMPRMRRLFGRIRPDRMEINILRGVLTHIEKAMR